MVAKLLGGQRGRGGGDGDGEDDEDDDDEGKEEGEEEEEKKEEIEEREDEDEAGGPRTAGRAVKSDNCSSTSTFLLTDSSPFVAVDRLL